MRGITNEIEELPGKVIKTAFINTNGLLEIEFTDKKRIIIREVEDIQL